MLGIEGSTFTVDGIDRGTYGGKSLLFDGSADYLRRTFSTPTDANVWTFSCWVKRSELNASTGYILLIAGTAQTDRCEISITADRLRFVQVDSSAATDDVSTTAYLRDTHGWVHLMIAYNSDEATASDRVKMYINGVQQTDFSTANYPTSGATADINTAIQHTIGATTTGSASFMDGYLADYYFIDGQALTPSSFGHTATDTGKWVASNTSGLTFGTNGFSLDFNDDRSGTPDTTTTIYDQSGNSNNWTGTSLVAGSFTGDTPVDNYATLNPLDVTGTATLSNGNLTITSATTSHKNRKASILMPTTGKWYWEVTTATACDATHILGWGLQNRDTANDAQMGNANTWMAQNDANQDVFNETTGVLSNQGSAIAANAIRQFAYDADTGKLWFGIDDTWYSSTDLTSGNPSAGTNECMTLSAGLYIAAVTAYNLTAVVEFGAGGFTHTPPTDFLPLSSANLPVPDEPYRKPQNFADILLYTGNGTAIGSGGNAVTGAAFTPDFTWIKNRDAADSHQWTDIVRGVTKNLSSDSTAEEGTDTEGLTSFTSGGFTVGSDVSYNTNTEDYWSMCLKADNTSGASNTDGTITSTVAAGEHFSIVTYTGTGVAATIGHGLGKIPDLIIHHVRAKNGATFTANWPVYHSSNTSAPQTDFLALNTTDATSDNTIWNDTAPTDSVFSVSTQNLPNSSGSTYVAYCFVFDTTDANSPFTGGVYTGNGSTDGTFVPSDELIFFMAKETSAISNWQVLDSLRDPYNVAVYRFFPNLSQAESTSTDAMDFLSNGVKMRTTDSSINAAQTMIWWGIKKNGGQLWA